MGLVAVLLASFLQLLFLLELSTETNIGSGAASFYLLEQVYFFLFAVMAFVAAVLVIDCLYLWLFYRRKKQQSLHKGSDDHKE